MYGELPFKPSAPNAETIEALKDGEHPERMTTHTLEEFKRLTSNEGYPGKQPFRHDLRRIQGRGKNLSKLASQEQTASCHARHDAHFAC
jgi:hypothetical protein